MCDFLKLPGFIIEPVMFACIVYWIVGLRPTLEAFLLTTAVLVMTANTSAACGNYGTGSLNDYTYRNVIHYVTNMNKYPFANFIGCFFSAAFDSVNLAITALIPFDYMLMITGGLFIKLG